MIIMRHPVSFTALILDRIESIFSPSFNSDSVMCTRGRGRGTWTWSAGLLLPAARRAELSDSDRVICACDCIHTHDARQSTLQLQQKYDASHTYFTYAIFRDHHCYKYIITAGALRCVHVVPRLVTNCLRNDALCVRFKTAAPVFAWLHLVVVGCLHHDQSRGAGSPGQGVNWPLKFEIGVKKMIPRLCRTGDLDPLLKNGSRAPAYERSGKWSGAGLVSRSAA